MDNKFNEQSNQSGYSLVELSIVLVIIGFLIAAVTAGRSLIKQAELRSVMSDFSSYEVMYNNFVLTYSQVPGDMSNAYLIWGAACAATNVLCDGNGDGVIQYNNSSTTTDEVNKAWNHLYNAGILPYSIAAVTSVTTTIGVNAPPSKVTGSGYILAGAITPFTSTINAIFIGNQTSGDSLTTGTFAASDAWSIDEKMDDGSIDSSGNFTGAISGVVRSLDGNGVASGNCAASATGYYNIPISSVSCRVGMAVNQ